MADREFKILVSWSLARNSGAVFQEAEASSSRARARVEGDAKAAAATQEREARRAAASQEKAAKQASDAQSKAADKAASMAAKAYQQIVTAAERAAAQEAAAAQRAAQQRVAADQRAFDQKLKLSERAAAQAERARQRENASIERDVARAQRQEEAAASRAAKAAERRREAALKGFASDTFSGISGTASRAMGVGSAVASGMGVKMDLGNQVASAGEFKRQVVDVTNAGMGIQGKLAGKGDYDATTKAIEGAADQTKIAQNTIAQGLSIFVDKASDIEAGKAMLKGLGDIAQASGTDFVELAGSAGEFFKMMGGEGPEKIKNVQKLLALAAKQGQVGNLAFKELAPTIGKLAAQGQKIKGDYTENVGQLMALAQVSLQGGATKGAEANRAAQAFVMDQTKGSSLKTFAKYGVKIFEDQDSKGGGTTLRNQHELIRELFSKNAGNLKTITDEFKGQKSGNVITGFANIFRDAGGTGGKKGDVEKGLAAIDATFKKFTQPMGEAEIQNSAKAVRETSGAKAEAFNNQLQRIASSLADNLLPQFEKLAPKLLELADSFSKVVAWAAENPGMAITGAIVGSIAKAGIGTIVSTTLAELIKSAVKGAGGGAGAGSALGLAGSAIAITAAAITVFAAGTAVIDKTSQNAAAGQSNASNMDAVVMNALTGAAYAKRTGKGEKEAMAELERVQAMQIERMNAALGPSSLAQVFNPFSDTTMSQHTKETTDADHIQQLSADMKAMTAAIKSLKEGVHVTNMPAGGPNVPPPAGGRVGVPGHGG